MLYFLKDLVHLRRTSFPGDQPNIDSLYNLWAMELDQYYWPQEELELTDCLYRNRGQHKYITVLDLDEMIVPQRVPDWHQLIDQIEVRSNSIVDSSKLIFESPILTARPREQGQGALREHLCNGVSGQGGNRTRECHQLIHSHSHSLVPAHDASHLPCLFVLHGGSQFHAHLRR